MKALTLTQPWATLIAVGAKRIETRNWSTDHRGKLAIHAAKGLDPVGGRRGLFELCHTEPFLSALKRDYPDGVDDVGARVDVDALPRGAVVAIAELIEVVPITCGAPLDQVPGGAPPYEEAFGDFSPGRFAWLLADVRALDETIPARGELGLWTWLEAPAGLAAATPRAAAEGGGLSS